MRRCFIPALLLTVVLITTLIGGCKEGEKKKVDTGELSADARPVVLLVTSMGNIEIELRPDTAPKTVMNFLKLTREGFYNGLTFHRVIPGFMIQGGDPKGDGTGGPGYTIPAEIKLPHNLGAVAMARKSDQVNPQRASSGSQFYIAVKPLPNLDRGGYTVFGYVTKGMDVAQKIVAVERDQRDKPLTPVLIKEVKIIKSK